MTDEKSPRADLSAFDAATIERARVAVREYMDWISDTGGDETGKLSPFAQDALVHQFAWYLSRRSHPSGYRLVPVEPTDGWQPIETAPKDGTRVLLFEPDGDGGEIVACVWGLYFPGPHNVPEFRAIREYGWVEFSGHSGGATIDHPTHWQPLPAAPSPKEGK